MLNANEIQVFMNLFKGSSKAFMEQQSNGGYFPQDRPLEEADIQDHLKGDKTLGIYLVEPELNTVNFLALDIDKRDKALLRALFEAAFEIGIKDNQVLIEDSGNKGWHIWIPFANPVPANKARILGEIIVKVSKTKEIIEIFPKQTRVALGGYGNGIKLPLGKHKKTGNFSFFIYPGTFQELNPNRFTFIHKVTESEIEVILEEFPEFSKPKLPQNPALNSPQNDFNCINSVLKGVSEGNRDIALFNLAIHFLKEKKLPKNAVLSILNDWNRSNNPPLSTDIIENKINYISNSDKYTHFSCAQLKPFCSPDCPKLNKSNKTAP